MNGKWTDFFGNEIQVIMLSARDCVDLAIDCVFPSFCLNCEAEGEWLCDFCFSRVDCAGVFWCPICHTPTVGGVCCKECRGSGPLKRVIAITQYRDDWAIGRLMRAFKYQYALEIVPIFLRMMDLWILSSRGFFKDFDAIAPVPLHPRRCAERGFNQADIFSNALSDMTGIPSLAVLKRKRYTAHQARLKKEDRAKNILGAFEIDKIGRVKGRNILLVDDIYTTGSTMGECADTLLNAGAASVSGFAIARG